MSNSDLDAKTLEIDRKKTLAPVTYLVRLHGPLALALEKYADAETASAEMIIREAVRAYIGDALR